MGWIGFVCCENSRRDFMARTFALIVPAHTILHRVSCSYERITDELEHYETYQNISLGSNGVDWVHSLRKIPTWLRRTNSCINCTSSPYFGSSFMELRNDPKCTQTLYNAPKHEFRVQWGRLGAFVVKIPTWLRGTNFCFNCTSSLCFPSSFMQLWNEPKCTQTMCNEPKHEFRVQWGGLRAFVQKNPGGTSWHELSH